MNFAASWWRMRTVATTAEPRGWPRRALSPWQAHRGNDFTIITSPEFTPFKGLQHRAAVLAVLRRRHDERVRPACVGRSSLPRRNLAANNTTTNSASTFGNADNVTNGSTAMHEIRHTIGADARWRFGASAPIRRSTSSGVHATPLPGRAALAAPGAVRWQDVVFPGRYLGLEPGARPAAPRGSRRIARVNKARDSLAQGVHYFEPIDMDTGYYSTWGAILALSDADFGTGLNNGGMTTNVGYDRYGRASIAMRATYSLTPALAFYGTVSPTWTAQKVDTDNWVLPAPRAPSSVRTASPRVTRTTSALSSTSVWGGSSPRTPRWT